MTLAGMLSQIADVQISEWLGYAAAGLVFATFSMKTMVPLRVIAIASNVLFLLYGYLHPAYPVLVLHLALLPLNLWRLQQMLALVRETAAAHDSDLDMNWIKPFTTTRDMKPGEVLFRKGDPASEIIFIMSGSLRTQSAVCVDGGQILVITYDQVRQLIFQNPKFGYYFMQLSARRLFENMKRMQAEIERLRRSDRANELRVAEP